MRHVQPLTLLPIVVVAFLALACGAVTGLSGESANRGGVIAPATERPAGLDAYLELPDDKAAVVFPYSEVTVQRAEGPITLGVLVADTGARRNRGLMYWTDLPAGIGMIFIWPGGGERRSGFWNQNVPIDLSVAFLDKDGIVQEFVTLNARDEQVKSPANPYVFALEVPHGRFAELGIQVGDQVLIPSSLIGD